MLCYCRFLATRCIAIIRFCFYLSLFSPKGLMKSCIISHISLAIVGVFVGFWDARVFAYVSRL